MPFDVRPVRAYVYVRYGDGAFLPVVARVFKGGGRRLSTSVDVYCPLCGGIYHSYTAVAKHLQSGHNASLGDLSGRLTLSTCIGDCPSTEEVYLKANRDW